MEIARQAWNKTKAEDDPEFDSAAMDPEFRLKLHNVAAGVRDSNLEHGIAGLEKYEEEVRKLTKDEDKIPHTNVSVHSGATAEDLGQPAEPQPKGSGAQTGAKAQEAKALKDAAAAGSREEMSGVNSPPKSSAARPLAAEAPGNTEAATKAAEESGKADSKASKKSTSKSRSKAGKKAGK